MDGELGDPEHGPVGAEELVADGAGARPDRHPSGQTEVAIEPRVDQCTAVHLDPELAESCQPRVGPRPDAQVG